VLDGLVRFRFGENAELMACASARNVLGPFKPKGESGAGGSETLRSAQGRLLREAQGGRRRRRDGGAEA
jgi:hypothetical protein